MRIVQITAPAEWVTLEVPIPTPEPGEALLQVQAVTTCPQWDLHLAHNEPMFVGHRFTYPYPPGQPGHEATGVIAAVGPGVSGLAVGDRVSAWKDAGHETQGCYAEYVVRKAEHLVHVPAEMSPEATAPVELAMCVGAAFLMLRDMNAVEGRIFGINGLGPAGLIALQMARAEGASRLIGFDLSEARRARGIALGLDEAWDPRSLPDGRFQPRPHAAEIECAVDCVGARASVEFLMDRTADVLALFGVQREAYSFEPRHYGGLRLCGYKGHSRAAAEYAVGLMAARKIDLAPLSTHHLDLEQYGEALGLLERQEAVKVCFWPGGVPPKLAPGSVQSRG